MSNDEILDRLVKIRMEFERILRNEGILPVPLEDRLKEVGFTRAEARRWIKTETDFTKRIATPLPTKRRRRVTFRKVTASLRLLCFSFLL